MSLKKLVKFDFNEIILQYLIVLLGITVISIGGCSNSGSELIGVWNEYSQYEYGISRAEFFKDGSCYFESSNQRIASHWSVLEDGRIKVEVTHNNTPTQTIFATVTGDILVTDWGGENKFNYVRNGSQHTVEIQAKIKKAIKEREIRIEAENKERVVRQEAEKRQAEKEFEILLHEANRKIFLDACYGECEKLWRGLPREVYTNSMYNKCKDECPTYYNGM